MDLFTTAINRAKAEHVALIEQLAASSANIATAARISFIDRLVGEMKGLLPSTIRYAEVEQYLTDLPFPDLIATAIAVNGPQHVAMECAKLERCDADADVAKITVGAINQMSQAEGAVVNGWLSSISSAFHLCKANGHAHDAGKLAEVLRYLGSNSKANPPPVIVVQKNGGVINGVFGNASAHVIFLDEDIEGADIEGIANIDGEHVYVSTFAIQARANVRGYSPDYVDQIQSEVAQHFASIPPDAPSA